MRIVLSGLWPPSYRGKYKKWKKILTGLSEALGPEEKRETARGLHIFSQLHSCTFSHIFALGNYLLVILSWNPQRGIQNMILLEDDLLNLYSTSLFCIDCRLIIIKQSCSEISLFYVYCTSDNDITHITTQTSFLMLGMCHYSKTYVSEQTI